MPTCQAGRDGRSRRSIGDSEGGARVNDYEEFLESKQLRILSAGPSVSADQVHPRLFPFQRDLVRWAVHKGRAALFADTGLGKTCMQLEWARLLGERTLIVAPLSVARQTMDEGRKIDVPVAHVRDQADVHGAGIYVTNYEMVEHFDPAAFGAVVIDESSILKALDGKTRHRLTEMFGQTPYRLCCTATPAPNDIAEIANHAEFLGIMNRADMLATFFVHADEGWRLKGHARDAFFRWLSSWGMSIRMPSDLGYEDDGFVLPPLRITPRLISTGYRSDGALFFLGLKGLQHRSAARRGTIEARVAALAEHVNSTPGQWLVWCGLNSESAHATVAIPGAVEVAGTDGLEQKIERIQAFQDGHIRVLVTKAKIAGFGLNFQCCHQVAFLGLNDSWETYYQCIRRCWRFGQQYPVDVEVLISDVEQEVWINVQNKEREALAMTDKLIQNVRLFEREELEEQQASYAYETDTVEGEGYRMILGDSVDRMAEVPDRSVDFSIFSPPFLSLYTYSPTPRDVGNSRTPEEFAQHFGYIIDHLRRITRPGRLCAVHVSQVPAMLSRDGYIGLKDFRGYTIGLFEARGWIYHGEICIDKDPQAQAIRVKAKALLFAQLRRDASWLRPAMADYILAFRAPGDNAVPILPDITNNEWIEWARPIWYGIKETETLNAAEARQAEDERHICPLQLGVIERCIRLWSNPGETVCSPFAGIGSEGYMALKLGRHFVGCELRRSYFDVACRNLARVSSTAPKQLDLLVAMEATG